MMAMKMDEALDMSLDDYIAMFKKTNGPSSNKTESNFNETKFGRRKSNDEEDMEEEILVAPGNKEETASSSTVDVGIWKGPDSTITYLDCNNEKNDLRQKLNNNNQRKPVSSVQYRLMAPNNSADRPRGIPTLLPLDAYVQKQNDGKNNNRRNYRGNKRRRNHGFNGFNNNRFGGIDMGGMNSGYVQRNRAQDVSKNLRLTVNRNGFNDAESIASQSTARNMIIECPSNSINLQPSPQMKGNFQRQFNTSDVHGNKSIPIGNPTPQAQTALDLYSNISPTSAGNNDSLRSVLGFQGNVTGDMMPVFATRLMELIKNSTQAPVHKPIYDMKIQKDIHEIQNKPLLYKCPGGEVVSSDGAGVNCQIIPRTSGISLNCRFA